MSPRSSTTSVRQLEGDVIRVQVEDKAFLAAAACPHRKGRLAYGYVNARRVRITCPLHYSVFDLETGCPLAGPATDPLRVTPADPGRACGPDAQGPRP